MAFSYFSREREILKALYRYGFHELLSQIGWLKLPAFLFPKAKAPLGERIVSLLEELGPLYIKLGQFLSTRFDLLPEEILSPLRQLQDQVSPLPFSVIEKEIQRELGRPLEEVFLEIDPSPLGSASIAQVHAAKLKPGIPVVIKVRRPGIWEQIQQDLALWRRWLSRLSPHSQWLQNFAILSIFEEFQRALFLELDLRREARYLVRIRQNLSLYPWIHIPRVFWKETTSKILVMERLEGVKVLEYQGSRGAKKLLAQRGAKAIFHQVFVDGLFHSDPHPGNILILPKEQIGFLDFGLVGRLDTTMRRHIFHLIQGILLQDGDILADAILQICHKEDRIPQEENFRRDLLDILDHFYGLPVKYIQFHQVLTELFSLARRYHLHIPTEYTLVAKALLTIEQIATLLDPDFHLVESLTDFLREEVFPKEREKRPRQVLHTALRLGETLEELPLQLRRMLCQLERGQFSLELKQPRWVDLISQVGRASQKITAGLILCALIIGSALIITSPHRGEYTLFGYDALGLLGFLIAATLGIFLIFSPSRPS